MGYQYRWDADGNGQFDSDKTSDQTTAKVHVNEGAQKTVQLEATSVFGFHSRAAIPISRAAKPAQLGLNQ
jgi:hypothetical protein